MSAKAEKVVSVPKRAEQIVVEFDANNLKAPFLLRLGSLLIDYIILVSVPIISLLIGRFVGHDGAKLLNSPMNSVGWLVFFLLFLTNFVILPIFGGQSIGKFFTGLRIVNLDGTSTGFVKLLLRNTVGYILTLATGLLGFFFSFFNTKGRALHDYLAGTMVIYGQKKPKLIVQKAE
jgi:uncharacterized RDD family membrane protein YckC